MKPLNLFQVVGHLDKYFQKLQDKNQNKPIQIRVYSRKLGLDYCYPAKSSNQPYHVASIGKMFTATLVQMLAERRLLGLKDTITTHLAPSVLERLFIYRGDDYANQVTIEQLLGHTSGVADYFEGGTSNGKSFMDEVISNPQYHWTPSKLLDFTRE